MTNYVQTVMGLSSILAVDVVFIGNESLISRGRNTLISYFHQLNLSGANYTHLLWLDADVGMHPKDLQQLVCSGHDVAAAAVALKGCGPTGCPILNGQITEGAPVADWMPMNHIGTAVLCFSREVVTALVEDALKDDRFYKSSSLTIGSPEPATHFDIFQTGVQDGVYWSEDFWVCRKLRNLGFQIMCNTTIKTTHMGTAPFSNMAGA